MLASTCSAATFVVDNQNPRALDTNVGTRESPLKTISAAAKKAQAGDEVLVRPGTYREAVTLANSGREGAPIVLRSEVPRGAIISGSDVISNWKPESPGVWSFEAPKIKKIPYLSGNADWVYANGFPLQEAPERAQLAPGSFFRDFEAKRVFVSPEEGDVQNLKIEYANREGLISTAASLDDIHIVGFQIVHNAGWARGKVALGASGRRWIIENNRIAWSSYGGIATTRTNGCIVRANLIEWCGDNAIGGGANLNLLVENNKFLHSNWRRINPNFEGGVSKWVYTLSSFIRGNESAYTFGYGLWTDIHNFGNIFEQNISHDEIFGASLFTEISSGDIFRDNIVFNSNTGITIGESPATLVQRNIVWNNNTGIRMRGNYRRANSHNQSAANNGSNEDNLANVEARVRTIPDISEAEVAQHMARYSLYWRAPGFHMSNNSSIEENIVFGNGGNYYEHRNYGVAGELDPFINNFSDRNIWWNADLSKNFAFSGGTYATPQEWQKIAKRDLNSTFANPRLASTSLPDWAQKKRALWDVAMRPQKEINDLKLGLLDSPSSAELRGRMMRSKYLEPLKISDTRVKAFVMEVEGERTIALWTSQAGERRVVRLNVGVGTCTVQNPFNGKTTRSLADNTIEVAATFLPIYVRGVGANVTEAPTSTLGARAFNLTGQPVPLSATFVNESKQPQVLEARFGANIGYSATPASVRRTLKAGERVSIPVTLAPDNSFARGVNVARVEATLGAQKITRTSAFSVGEGGGKVLASVRPKVIDGKLDDWDTSPAALTGEISEAAQVVNGDAKKWSGASDLNARLYTSWDAKYLYAAVAVRDDSVLAAPSGEMPYNFDGVELFVDGRAGEMQWQAEPTEGVYQLISGASVEGQKAPLQVLARSTLSGAEVASARTADGYSVEFRIPLSSANFSAGEWASGRPVRMSLIVDDKDDAGAIGREVAFGWSSSPGGANHKDTSGWKTLVLE